MKKVKIQIQKRQLLLSLGLVAFIAALGLGFQEDPIINCGPAREMKQPVNDPAQHFEGSFETFAPAVRKVSPAVVKIVTALKLESLPELSGGLEHRASGSILGQVLLEGAGRVLEHGLGSGVIVTEDGYILTNSHLVSEPNEIQVTLQDGRQFKAKVIGLDPKSDIAVVKIEAHHLRTVPIAESRNVQVGDPVLAFGYPFGVGQTVTHGIVSATDQDHVGIEDYESFIQTDAPINPGNSGGALVDVAGHLIGINTAILSSSGGNLGIGFAIPSDLARKVMADLMKYGYVVRGYLGVEIQDLTPGLAKEFKLHGATGVLAGDVLANSPAEKAGLRVGDVVTQFDGKEAQGSRQLNRLVADAKPGQAVPIQVLRDGWATRLLVTIGQASKDDLIAKVDQTPNEQDPGKLQGVVIGELNGELRLQLKIPRNVQGALVFAVHPFSAAAGAGLRSGDVIESINRQEVGNSTVASQLAQAARNQRILLRVWSQGSSHFILVDEE